MTLEEALSQVINDSTTSEEVRSKARESLAKLNASAKKPAPVALNPDIPTDARAGLDEQVFTPTGVTRMKQDIARKIQAGDMASAAKMTAALHPDQAAVPEYGLADAILAMGKGGMKGATTGAITRAAAGALAGVAPKVAAKLIPAVGVAATAASVPGLASTAGRMYAGESAFEAPGGAEAYFETLGALPGFALGFEKAPKIPEALAAMLARRKAAKLLGAASAPDAAAVAQKVMPEVSAKTLPEDMPRRYGPHNRTTDKSAAPNWTQGVPEWLQNTIEERTETAKAAARLAGIENPTPGEAFAIQFGVARPREAMGFNQSGKGGTARTATMATGEPPVINVTPEDIEILRDTLKQLGPSPERLALPPSNAQSRAAMRLLAAQQGRGSSDIIDPVSGEVLFEQGEAIPQPPITRPPLPDEVVAPPAPPIRLALPEGSMTRTPPPREALPPLDLTPRQKRLMYELALKRALESLGRSGRD